MPALHRPKQFPLVLNRNKCSIFSIIDFIFIINHLYGMNIVYMYCTLNQSVKETYNGIP